jgi:two-component system, OmpR family, sensor histidine kinase PhoQ
VKRNVWSLTGRLILGSALLLPLFLGASGWYLERSHRASLEAGEAERLPLQVFALLAQADYNDGLMLPDQLLEPRYQQPNSGLYARITGADGKNLWLSPSAVSLPAALINQTPEKLSAGERRFKRRDGMYFLSLQVLWEADSGESVPLQFTVMESSDPIDADIAVYRRHLLLWLGGSALLLLACQGVVLGWGLRPLRSLASEVAAIEAGNAEQLVGDYPSEVLPLTSNLNALLEGERSRRERVRNTLADLAHSLKTPLAVLRSASTNKPGFAELVGEQTTRMEQIVNYQLQRSAGGSHKLLQLVPLRPIIERLRDTLLKVYTDRSLAIDIAIDTHAQYRGDERDFLEIVGNVMDNACKYGRGKVWVSAEGGGSSPLTLAVEDNGPGIPEGERMRILQRGTRLDQLGSRDGMGNGTGQGLGLAVAADIIQSYRGSLTIETGESGGARVVLRFP